ncbi:Myosin-6 [Manis pentadactyla]|nr:Myosin-6 [Manis pentadactyla]
MVSGSQQVTLIPGKEGQLSTLWTIRYWLPVGKVIRKLKAVTGKKNNDNENKAQKHLGVSRSNPGQEGGSSVWPVT